MKAGPQKRGTSPFVALTRAERLAALAVLAGLALVTMPSALVSGEIDRMLLYAAFVVYLLALALPLLLPSFRAGIFHPLVFYVIWIGYKGLLTGKAMLPATGLDYHAALTGRFHGDLNLLVAESFALEALALISLYIGYALVTGTRPPTFRVPQISFPLFKTAVWVGVSALGLLVLIKVGGGLGQVLMQRGMASDNRIAAELGGQWNYLATIGVIAPLVWLACERNAVRRPSFWILVTTALAVKFMATGSRGGTVSPLIMIGAVWMLHHKVMPYRTIFIGIVVALMLVGGLGQIRSATQQVSDFAQISIRTGPAAWIADATEELRHKSGENSGELAVLGRVPGQVPYLYGESYLSIPFIFIPSVIWGDKPDAAGKLNAKRIYNRPSTAIPPGPVGEAYWNFSYVGVVLVFLLYGVFLSVAGAFYKANPHHPGVITAFVFVLFYLQPSTPNTFEFFHGLVPALLILVSFIVRLDGRILFKDPTHSAVAR